VDVPTINTTQTTVTQKCQRPKNPQHNNLKLLRCGFSGRWHLWATVYLLPALARTQRHSVKYTTPIVVVVTHSRSSDRVTAHLPHPRFTKYLTTILRSSYDNAKVTIDLQPPPPERSAVSGVALKATGVSGNMHTTGKESTCSFRDMLVDRQTDRQTHAYRDASHPFLASLPPGWVGVKVTARRSSGYLFQSSDDESQGGKGVEIRRRCGAAANQRLRN